MQTQLTNLVDPHRAGLERGIALLDRMIAKLEPIPGRRLGHAILTVDTLSFGHCAAFDLAVQQALIGYRDDMRRELDELGA